jgi:hypothetical protein
LKTSIISSTSLDVAAIGRIVTGMAVMVVMVRRSGLIAVFRIYENVSMSRVKTTENEWGTIRDPFR